MIPRRGGYYLICFYIPFGWWLSDSCISHGVLRGVEEFLAPVVLVRRLWRDEGKMKWNNKKRGMTCLSDQRWALAVIQQNRMTYLCLVWHLSNQLHMGRVYVASASPDPLFCHVSKTTSLSRARSSSSVASTLQTETTAHGTRGETERCGGIKNRFGGERKGRM